MDPRFDISDIINTLSIKVSKLQLQEAIDYLQLIKLTNRKLDFLYSVYFENQTF